MDWATIYYHQHRIAHLPVVYDQSHKFHHYLHDTTPFDAHIYGAGKFNSDANPLTSSLSSVCARRGGEKNLKISRPRTTLH